MLRWQNKSKMLRGDDPRDVSTSLLGTSPKDAGVPVCLFADASEVASSSWYEFASAANFEDIAEALGVGIERSGESPINFANFEAVF